MPFSCKRFVAFDLDDTLYKEVEYLESGYCAIEHHVNNRLQAKISLTEKMLVWWKEGENVFERLVELYPDILSKEDCLNIYRYHKPNIKLEDGALSLLDFLSRNDVTIGLITDGRERTQLNKIYALGLHSYIDVKDIIISESFGSEKPAEANYRFFMEKYPNAKYVYVGDNVKKDFVSANRLGWETICLLNDGRNIHSQMADVPNEYKALYDVHELKEIQLII